ncbi:bifunctional glycosyltransferase family 2 protein/CDP-glycerol:glycerophosphate glycerophosphotransferase [Streptomyces sp. NPDC005863]|uniref:bifunctional glycosyltransferase/CDP-glycerol:glycerophosphate glycerophosphotransferase n=1 Tax=unclassified Streptomyces TaxID=2593676 RepID=UPI0033C2541A
MPRFSVIVPVYQAQAWLHACLESVLAQSFTDLELIVVDDRSPDGCGAIVEEFAGRDPRVTSVRLPRRSGPGPARTAGMERATGDYLVFLDGDDTLTAGALYALSDRAKETGEPDVLLYDHVRAHWSGETVRDPHARHLTEEDTAPFRLADRPGLLRLRPDVWNKACRRDFVTRAGLTLPSGLYEGVAWTYPVLLAAGSLATLDRVCVHHRLRRHGAALGATSRRHFDVFEQYDRVFAFLDAHPELSAAWRPTLFRQLVGHVTEVFARPGGPPRDARAAFLRTARARCRRHRAPGVRAPAGARVRHTLVRLGAHRTYRCLLAVTRLRGRAGRAARLVRRRVKGALLQLHYRVQLRLPVRANHAVFAAYGGRGHGCHPGALETAMRELVPGIRTAWIAHPRFHHTIPTGTRRLRPGTAAYWSALARSKYLVNNADFDRGLVKRPGQVFVQTQHGTPLKHMGLDLRERPAAARATDFDVLLRNADKWDYVVSANRHSTLVWERVFPAGYTTLEYGSPRNDRFQRATSAEVTRLRASLGIPHGAVAVLYAPTHRDHLRGQRHALDLERMLHALGPRFVLLTRAHHRYGAPMTTGEPTGRLIDVSDHPSVESLCLASDALITDYSSLMFDYAGLDRPIVLYVDDWEAYEAARGTYFDVREFPPGAVARGQDELTDIFVTGHWAGSRSAQLRRAFRERFCAYDDGGAAERVVRHVVLGETGGLPAVVPQAERYPAPAVGPRPDRVPYQGLQRSPQR